jgi:hypothetical protein
MQRGMVCSVGYEIDFLQNGQIPGSPPTANPADEWQCGQTTFADTFGDTPGGAASICRPQFEHLGGLSPPAIIPATILHFGHQKPIEAFASITWDPLSCPRRAAP